MANTLQRFGSQLPIVGGFLDDSEDQALDQLKQNKDLYGNLQTPTFDKYNPVLEQVAGEYDPESAQATTVAQDPATRSAQMSALSDLSRLSQTGLSDADQAEFAQAGQQAGQIAHAGTGAALNNAVSRGIGGSGMEFALREQAGQDAAQQAQTAGLQTAANAARQRAMYNQAYLTGEGSLRGQDFGENAANADILNRFNMANTQARNQGRLYNLNNAQSVSNQNAQTQNQGQQYNNQLKHQGYQDQYQKVSGQAGANTNMAQGYGAENAANSSARNANTALLVNGIKKAASGGADGEEEEGG